jgi:hypothetical protein
MKFYRSLSIDPENVRKSLFRSSSKVALETIKTKPKSKRGDKIYYTVIVPSVIKIYQVVLTLLRADRRKYMKLLAGFEISFSKSTL